MRMPILELATQGTYCQIGSRRLVCIRRCNITITDLCRAQWTLSAHAASQCGSPHVSAVRSLLWAVQRTVPRRDHMLAVDVRAVAVGAAVLGLTFTWLRGRAAQRHTGRRHRGGSGGGHSFAPRLLQRGRQLTAGPGEVSLVSYNILCQRYANARRLPHVFAQYLDPEYRWQRLQAELEAFGSDLVALQEVTVDRWPELQSFMASRGYGGLAQAKAAASGSDFMLALFWREDRWRLTWHEERSRVLLASLECVAAGPAAGEALWVANVHLEGSPYRPNDRVSQLKSALHRLEGHFSSREEAEAANVIICGDFNSVKDDSPCWLLRRGRLERNHTDAICPQVPTTKETIAHPFALHEVYEAAGVCLPYTRKVGREGAVLDFLWASRSMAVRALMRPLQQELRPLVDKYFLPNRWHPSDHLPIGAVLQLGMPAVAIAVAGMQPASGGNSGGT